MSNELRKSNNEVKDAIRDTQYAIRGSGQSGAKADLFECYFPECGLVTEALDTVEDLFGVSSAIPKAAFSMLTEPAEWAGLDNLCFGFVSGLDINISDLSSVSSVAKKANNQSKNPFIRAIRRVWSLTSRLSLRQEAHRRDERHIAATEDKTSATDDVSPRQKMYRPDRRPVAPIESISPATDDVSARQAMCRRDNQPIREVSAIVAGMVKISTLYLKGTNYE